jgi:predicted outer membrane protein
MRRFAAAFVSTIPFVAFAADIPDLAFYRNAAEGGLAEVAMGNMAQQQAHSPSVREFGALMVKDHEEDIAEFKKEAASGRDPDARAFASATLPTLEAHLKKIQSIAAEAGVSAD